MWGIEVFFEFLNFSIFYSIERFYSKEQNFWIKSIICGKMLVYKFNFRAYLYNFSIIRAVLLNLTFVELDNFIGIWPHSLTLSSAYFSTKFSIQLWLLPAVVICFQINFMCMLLFRWKPSWRTTRSNTRFWPSISIESLHLKIVEISPIIKIEKIG